MLRPRTKSSAFIALALLAACGGDDAQAPDAGAPADAAPDASPDATPDAASPDAMPDAAPDWLVVEVSGAGTVDMEVRGTTTTCSSTCTIDVAQLGYEDVILRPHAGSNATFQGWRGCYMRDDESCHALWPHDAERTVGADFAPLTVAVATSFGDGTQARVQALASDAAGNVVVEWLGHDPPDEHGYATEHTYLTAVNPDGTRRWQRDWAFADPLAPRGLAVAPDGTVRILGTVGTGENRHAEMLTLDGATGTETDAFAVLDHAVELALAANGEVVVCTSSYEGVLQHEAARYSPAGVERWHSQSWYGACERVAALADGGALVQAYELNGEPAITSTSYGPAGERRWDHDLAFFQLLLSGGVVDAGEGRVVAATIDGGEGYLVANQSATGAELWRTDFHTAFFRPFEPTLLDGRIVVAASLGLGGTVGDFTVTANDDAGLLELDPATGDLVVVRRIAGPGHEAGAGVAAGPDGSRWIAGTFDMPWPIGGKTLTPGSTRDVFLLRVTP